MRYCWVRRQRELSVMHLKHTISLNDGMTTFPAHIYKNSHTHTANHYNRNQPPNRSHQQHQDEIFVVQQPLPPLSRGSTASSTASGGVMTTSSLHEHHPPMIHIKRPHQRSILIVNDGTHQRPPGWRLQGHCEMCYVHFGLFTRRHVCMYIYRFPLA